MHVAEDGTTPVDERERSVHVLLEHPNGYAVRSEDEEGSSQKKRRGISLSKKRNREEGFCKIQI
jgi:hypothetical protein